MYVQKHFTNCKHQYIFWFTLAFSKEKTHTFLPEILYKDSVLLETEVIK